MGLPIVSSAQLVSTIKAALPGAHLAELFLAAPVSGATPVATGWWVLPLVSSDGLEQQVSSAVEAGVRQLLLLAGAPLPPAVAAAAEAVMEAAGGELLVVLCGAAVCSNPQLMAYALLVAAGLPSAAVLSGIVLPEEAARPSEQQQQQQVTMPVAQQEVDQLQVMAGVVQDTIREVLGAAPGSAIPEDEPLMLAGVNSTAAVALTQRLQSTLGVDLPATLVFDHPTVRDISEFLTDSYAGAALPAAAVPAASAGGEGGGGGVATRAAAEQLVMSTVRDLLGLPAGQQGPDAGTPLMVAGLNSTAAVAFTSRLAEALGGVTLPPTLVFDYPSGQAIADYLVEADLMPAAATAAAAPVTAASAPRPGALGRAPAAAGGAVAAPSAAEEVVLVVASAHRQAGGGLQDIFRGERAKLYHLHPLLLHGDILYCW